MGFHATDRDVPHLKTPCPECGGKLIWRARIDSDDRVEAKWRACEECKWDQRRAAR